MTHDAKIIQHSQGCPQFRIMEKGSPIKGRVPRGIAPHSTGHAREKAPLKTGQISV